MKREVGRNIIEVSNLSKTYEVYRRPSGLGPGLKSLFRRQVVRVPAVRNISFAVGAGEFVGFVGPNGAGKTTTLKMLTGILYPSAGQATVLGFVPWERHRAMQQQIAIVLGQKNQLLWDLPVMDSFLLNKAIYGLSDRNFKSSAKELAGLLQIKDLLNTPVRKLSLGERLKAELIAALLHRPKVLFLDEPTIGLDVVAQQQLRLFLKRINERRRTTILLTSHNMDDIRELCPRVIIIDKGRLWYDGNFDSLIKKHAPHKVLRVVFAEPPARARLLRLAKVDSVDELVATLHVPRHETTAIAREILESFDVTDIAIEEEKVEDVVRQIFTGNR